MGCQGSRTAEEEQMHIYMSNIFDDSRCARHKSSPQRGYRKRIESAQSKSVASAKGKKPRWHCPDCSMAQAQACAVAQTHRAMSSDGSGGMTTPWPGPAARDDDEAGDSSSSSSSYSGSSSSSPRCANQAHMVGHEVPRTYVVAPCFANW